MERLTFSVHVPNPADSISNNKYNIRFLTYGYVYLFVRQYEGTLPGTKKYNKLLWVYSYSYFLQLITAYSILSMVDSNFFSPTHLFVRILYSYKQNTNKNKDKTPI